MQTSQDQHDAGGSHTRRDNTESIAQDVRRAAEAAKQQGAEAFSQVSEQAARYADREKEVVGEHLQEFARAVRHAGDELGRRDQTMGSQLVREAASGLESLSRSVSGSSIRDMLGSVREFGRANPAAFIGGAVLAGLALGRFARASGSRAPNDGEEAWRHGVDGGDFERERYRGSGYPAGGSPPFNSPSRGGADAAMSGAPEAAQGYAGGGMAADSVRSSTPSSATDVSMSTGSSVSDSETATISTGESS
jgi:hypothetical protein